MGGPRQGLEPGRGDRLAAAQARPERTGVEPGERGVDEFELLDRPVPEGEVSLLLEDLGRRGGLRAVGHLTRCLDGFAELADQVLALRAQGRANGVDVDSVHRRTVRRPAVWCRSTYTPWEYQQGD